MNTLSRYGFFGESSPVRHDDDFPMGVPFDHCLEGGRILLFQLLYFPHGLPDLLNRHSSTQTPWADAPTVRLLAGMEAI